LYYRTLTNVFCSDPNNLTGLCNRNSCPLANSRYATIYEDKGICYLKIKTAERAHTPKELWESIRLDASYKKALEKIDEELIYWPKFIIHKCKQRFTRIRQVLVKRRKIKLEGSAEYQIISRKAEKREKSRLVKAEKAAVIESHIAEELLKNLKKGKYNEIYNYPGNVLERVLENENVIEDKEEQYNEEDFDKGYVVSDYSDEEGEDVDDYEEDEDEEQDEDGNVKEDNEDDYSDIFGKNDKEDNVKDSKSSNKKGGVIGKKTKRKGKVNIEYEQEYETAAPMKKTSTVDF
jgi:protein MAK16